MKIPIAEANDIARRLFTARSGKTNCLEATNAGRGRLHHHVVGFLETFPLPDCRAVLAATF
jgi:hypothetical protein